MAQTRDGIKIKFHDKRAALMDIGRHLGMFKERVEMTGKDSGPLEVATSMTEVAKLLLSMLHEAEPSLSDGDRLPALGHKSAVEAAIADDGPYAPAARTNEG